MSAPAPLLTARLLLRPFVAGDAPFVLALLNDPDWIRYIGDRGIRTVAEAQAYLERGPIAMYREHGLGLLLVADRASGEPLGMTGLIRRTTLPDVDLGFAFLPQHRGRGLAREAAAAVLRHGHHSLGLARIVAIATPANERSIALLRALGMRDEGLVTVGDEALALYASEVPASREETAP